ncbi:hypothetical protein [Kutzneria sp. NPDC052558]|uniref:hypothetical protein n=1 Tax=Kutzneria sp. NPDC052558 TaxID=3364121 RepID=UPI0037C6C376
MRWTRAARSKGGGWRRRAVMTSPVPRLLAGGPAIVLERLAYGGGSTNWYRCVDQPALEALADELRHGSDVSFFFGDRFAHRRYTTRTRAEMARFMDYLGGLPGETGAIVVGHVDDDALHMTVDYPSALEEADDFLADFEPEPWIYYGRCPGWENDGVRAVNFKVPDDDGIVRPHAY